MSRSRSTRAVTTAVLAATGLVLGCGQDGRAHATALADSARAPEGATVKTTLVPVGGMSCASCAGRVKKALTELDGVVEAEVRLVERDARVKYAAEKLTPERIAEVIRALGYEVGTPRAVD